MATQLVKNFGEKEYMDKLRIAGWAQMDVEMEQRLLAIQAHQRASINTHASG